MNRAAPRLSTGRKLAYAVVAWALVLGTVEATLALTEPLWANDDDASVPLTRKEEERASEVLLGAADQRRLGDTLRFHVRSNVLTQHDPELLFRVKPNPTGEPIHDYTGINPQGFRGRGIEAPPGSARSIVLLGDSCGFGWGIHDYEQTIAARLEQTYAHADAEIAPRVVFNLSQPGYSSEQARMLFERWGETLEPDLLVIYLGWNDLYLSGSEDRDTFERLRIANAPGLRFARSTHTFRALEVAIDGLRGAREGGVSGAAAPPAGGVRRVSAEHSIENLRKVATSVRERGGYVVIVPPPALEWMQAGGMPEYIARLRAELSDIALFLELPRMQTSAPEYEAYFIRDGFHPNALGALYIARQLVRADIALERIAADDEAATASQP